MLLQCKVNERAEKVRRRVLKERLVKYALNVIGHLKSRSKGPYSYNNNCDLV